LCANCEVITEDLNGHCAGCGSESLLKLSTILGGTIVPEPAVGFAASATTTDDMRVCSLSAAA
jgi:hypothetical protein